MLVNLAYADALIREALDPAGRTLLRPFHDDPARINRACPPATAGEHQLSWRPLRAQRLPALWGRVQPGVDCPACA